MPRRNPSKAGDVPPSREEIADFVKRLEAWDTVSGAAASIGYSIAAVREMLRKGRAGEPGFDRFVEAYEDVTNRQSQDYWALLKAKADEGDFAALKYFHSKRLAPREDEIQKALVSDEFEVTKGRETGHQPPKVDLDALERRAAAAIRTEAAETPEGVH